MFQRGILAQRMPNSRRPIPPYPIVRQVQMSQFTPAVQQLAHGTRSAIADFVVGQIWNERKVRNAASLNSAHRLEL